MIVLPGEHRDIPLWPRAIPHSPCTLSAEVTSSLSNRDLKRLPGLARGLPLSMTARVRRDMTTSDPTSYSDFTNSRRRGPRIEVLGQIHGQLVVMDLPLLVRNLGAGGFGVDSSVPFAAGDVHTFRFTTASGIAVVARAQAKHCHEVKLDDGSTRYRAGFSFVHQHGGISVRTIEILLDAATADLSFP